jgi:uncharacterized membrane protein
MRGLAVLLPTVLTLFVFVTIFQFVDKYLTGPINGAIYGGLEGNGVGWTVLDSMDIDPYAREFLDEDRVPDQLRDRLEELGGFGGNAFAKALTAWRNENQTFLRDFEALAIDREELREATAAKVHPAVGVVLSLVLVLLLGNLTSGLLGRTSIAAFDRTLHRIPLVRSVYPYTKQIVEFFLSDESNLEFDSVVAAPYPSETVWALGFVTGAGMKSINEGLGGKFVSVFVPTSPMPMTGFTVFFERERLIPIDIPVDEALRVVVSAGVLVPPSERVEELTAALEAMTRVPRPAA